MSVGKYFGRFLSINIFLRYTPSFENLRTVTAYISFKSGQWMVERSLSLMLYTAKNILNAITNLQSARNTESLSRIGVLRLLGVGMYLYLNTYNNRVRITHRIIGNWNFFTISEKIRDLIHLFPKYSIVLSTYQNLIFSDSETHVCIYLNRRYKSEKDSRSDVASYRM